MNEEPSPGVRVLFASGGIGIPGGIANHSASVLSALGELEMAGRIERVDALLLMDERAPTPSPIKGAISLASSSKVRFASRLVRLARSRNPDLILFDSLSLARVMDLPLITKRYFVMVHGVELGPLNKAYAVRLLVGAAGVIANSQTTARRVMDLIPADRAPYVSIVNPCVNDVRIRLWSTLDGPPLRHRDPVVLTVGRMPAGQPGKGHQGLLEAWPIVVESVPGARLIVAGDGADRARLEALAIDFGIGASVEFVGYVSDEALGHLYATSAAFAMPSRQEGFGIVYAEAMWHGLPCLGSTADAAGDVIEDGVTGRLVPYAAVGETARALIEILTDRAGSERMGELGRQRCLNEFTHERLRNRLLQALVG